MMEIVAISRQSRFHTETLETSSTDVDLKGVNVTLGDVELLSDAHLRLFAGVHYGLVGRNGVGKSTLLKAIGHGILVGFPKNIRVLYVDQLENVDVQRSPLDIVLKADKEAVRMQGEAELLQRVTEAGEARAIARALQEVKLGRLEAEMREAQSIATLRSGTRGLEARKRAVELEARVGAARKEIEGGVEKIGAEELASAAIEAQEILDELFTALSLSDADAAESRARKILKGLGFTTDRQNNPLSQLSGGWRIRVALAQALFVEPEVLLLDEPTNHLDLPAILWLSSYLRTLESTTIVIVSHDRAFLNDSADEIIIFRNRTLAYHKGNYDEYEENAEDKREHMSRMKESVDRKRETIVKSIQEGVRQAKKSGDDKKLGMVASRKKKLDRLGLERNEHGHRFQINKDRAGYHNTAREEIVVEGPEAPVRWKLPAPSELRHHGALLEVEGVSYSYERARPPVVKDVTLNIKQGERIAIIGANGEGKTTLMKLMAGQLEPTRGTIKRHAQASVGFFMQNHVDSLCGPMGHMSALAHMKEKFPDVKEQDLRAHLGSFGVKGGLATQEMRTLSGGQAVRVAMAVTLLPGPHLLILDEPTNHLDMDTIGAMIKALQEYEGAVVVVSHDQYLVNTLAEEVFLVKKGVMTTVKGGMDEYKEKLLRRNNAR